MKILSLLFLATLLFTNTFYSSQQQDSPELEEAATLAASASKLLDDGKYGACNGPPYLSEAAVAAAMKARFTPTKLSGMPVKNYGVVFYRFVPR